VSPPEKVIRHVLVDELAVEKELDYTPAEALGHLLEVAEWDMDEIAVLIKAALQHDGVPMRIHGGAQPARSRRRTESKVRQHFPPRFLRLD